MDKIRCIDAVMVLKNTKARMTAKEIGELLNTDSRAVATALRQATSDGRVHWLFKKGIARYRFTRLTPNGGNMGSNK